MHNLQNLVLESTYGQNISVYVFPGSTQSVVVTPHSEYAFTSVEEAKSFAYQLASKQELLKTASLDRPQKNGLPPINRSKNLSRGFKF